jgi:hypothetical protein
MKQSRELLDGLRDLKTQLNLSKEERASVPHYALGVVSVLLSEEQQQSAVETVRNCILSARMREETEKAAGPVGDADGSRNTTTQPQPSPGC